MQREAKKKRTSAKNSKVPFDYPPGKRPMYNSSKYFHRNVDELIVGIESSVPLFVQKCVRVIESDGESCRLFNKESGDTSIYCG